MDFLPSEIEAIRRALAPKEIAAATIRKVSGRPTAGGGETRNKIGSFAGVSGRTVEKIAQVVKAAEEKPEKFGHLVEEMDRTGRVNGALTPSALEQLLRERPLRPDGLARREARR